MDRLQAGRERLHRYLAAGAGNRFSEAQTQTGLWARPPPRGRGARRQADACRGCCVVPSALERGGRVHREVAVPRACYRPPHNKRSRLAGARRLPEGLGRHRLLHGADREARGAVRTGGAAPPPAAGRAPERGRASHGAVVILVPARRPPPPQAAPTLKLTVAQPRSGTTNPPVRRPGEGVCLDPKRVQRSDEVLDSDCRRSLPYLQLSPDHSPSVGRESRSAVEMVFYASRKPFTRTLRYDTVH